MKLKLSKGFLSHSSKKTASKEVKKTSGTFRLSDRDSKMKDFHITKMKEKLKVEKLPFSPKTSEMPKWLDKHFSSETATRLKVTAGIGAGVGLLAAATNKQDDDVLSTGEKMIKYSSLGVAASYGGEIGLRQFGITSKNLAHSDVTKAAKKVMSATEEARWQKNMSAKLGVGMAIGIAAFSVATIADTFSGMSQERKASIDRNLQEQELVKKQTTEKRQQDKMGYGYVDHGQIVLQQWEKRIGHYAMGNAKFQ